MRIVNERTYGKREFSIWIEFAKWTSSEHNYPLCIDLNTCQLVEWCLVIVWVVIMPVQSQSADKWNVRNGIFSEMANTFLALTFPPLQTHFPFSSWNFHMIHISFVSFYRFDYIPVGGYKLPQFAFTFLQAKANALQIHFSFNLIRFSVDIDIFVVLWMNNKINKGWKIAARVFDRMSSQAA